MNILDEMQSLMESIKLKHEIPQNQK